MHGRRSPGGEAQPHDDALPHPTWTLGASGHVVRANRAWHDFTGHPSLDGTSLPDLVLPDDLPRLEAVLAREEPPTDEHVDVRLRRADGEYRWFRLHLHPAGRPHAWQVSGVDVHDLKHDQQQRQVLQDALDVSADCIKILGLDARLLSMNEGGRRVMEIDDFDACRNLLWPDFWHGDAREKLEDALDRARAGHRASFEGATATLKGTVKWWEVTVAPLFDEHGSVRQLVAVSRDITERRTAQADLQNLNATLEDRVTRRTRDLDEERAALDAFVTFAEAAGTTTDIPELARHALSVLRSHFTQASVAYYEPEGDVWRARAWTPDMREDVLAMIRSGVPGDLPLFAQALRTKQPVFVDAWNPEREQAPVTDEYGSGATYPLIVNDEVAGLLTVGLRDTRHWSHRHRSLVRAVGRSLNLAVERAATTEALRLRNAELDARTRALEAFADLTRDLALHGEPEALIKRAMQVVLSLLPPGHAAFYQIKGPAWRATIQEGDVGSPQLQAAIDAGFPVGKTPSLDRPARTREAHFQSRYDQALDAATELVRHLPTIAALPVTVNGAVLGVFNVALFHERGWSDADRAVLESTVRSLSVAVERARGVAQLETQRASLELANEELEAFAYSVSHDLRTPVRHIAGYSALLRRRLGGALDEQAARYLTVVDEAAGRMDNLIDAMLDLSRTARLPLRVGVVDLGALVQAVRAELEADALERRVTWRVGPLPLVRGDPDLLRQVMLNLLGNALKYTRTRDEAVIEVWAEDRPEETAVFVRDNGVGYDPRYADKLFGVFQRLHRAEEFEGTGIGLANVRRIVQRHGGQATAAGAVGAGATFGFTLPKRSASTTP